ncbi:2-polyprenyl-3-methyl-5-hydroxy-6-metoxy-1,4-benzoquinol methylase [Labedaea rhizosphaerae]|uniref:2-polyprenyl-3-methyl-5-hydroxy-6-metoxy-1, 4-benzoquinol methylase n=1 Tax=Labedaea rhizosphaerae TaxID=598644 RepID=A0A4R6SLC6_LABRH|nr:2-polyprenyl-3-methyl-5-hydroxy-6-metoxy-1,4-benzoquinol methylase [Labedaea rhizosphaerae]
MLALVTSEEPEDTVPAFDLIGERYDESFVERDAQLAEGAWLIENVPAGGRVLDLGCGSGLPTAKQLLEAGLAVTGIDESAKMLELAARQAPGGDYVHGDIRELPETLGQFDAVAAFFALLMLRRRDIPPLLRRCRELLRGPKLLSIGMVVSDFDMFPISFLGVPTHVTAYPPADLRQLVEDAGFEVLDVREHEVQAEPGRVEPQVFLRARAR